MDQPVLFNLSKELVVQYYVRKKDNNFKEDFETQIESKRQI